MNIDIKWNYELVKLHIEELGYKLIDTEFKKVTTHLEIEDEFGYKYYTTFTNLLNNRNPSKCHKMNKFTIYNIKLWLKINKLDFELISEKWSGNNSPLILKDSLGFYYSASWCTMQAGYLPERFYKTNPYTIQNIKLWIKSNYPKFTVLSDYYFGSDTKIILIDSEGFMYNPRWELLQQKSNISKFYKNNSYTIDNIKLWCKLNDKSFELLSTNYQRNSIKLKWKCIKENCGEIFETSWEAIKQGNGCPFCVGQKVCLSNCLATKNPELASEWHPIKNGDLTPYDVVCGTATKVWWKCSKNDNHIWKASINSRNQKNGCPHCSGFYPSEEYNLLINNPKLCLEWDYKTNIKLPNEYTPYSEEKVYWICNSCNYKWNAQIINRNSKSPTGCPKCNLSKGEIKISEVLNIYNIYNIPQKIFEGLLGLGNGNLSYDFYLPSYNLLIEFQGQFHDGSSGTYSRINLETQQEHDCRKRQYALDNNIRLLEIWYYDFDRIEEILMKELQLEVSA